MADSSAILNAGILIVDDLDANVQVLTQMLAAAGYTSVASTTDPLQVCGLHRRHRYDLIILDLLMPVMDGFQVMEGLKEIETDAYLPVLVISAQPDQKLHALHAGAKDFLSKPFELAEVLARVRNMVEVRLLHKELRSHNEALEQRVRERTAELQESYLESIFTMTRAAEHRDVDTGAHVQRISSYCRQLAKTLGLGDAFADRLYFASPMHDIGKIGIPDYVLLKPGSLTPGEWTTMETHTTIGAQILGNSRSDHLQMGAEIALNHHERWNGGGYPNGTLGEDIPMSARIMSICDVYDALRSKRPYKAAFDHAKAVQIVTRGDGRTEPAHFDPAVLAAFAEDQEAFGKIFDAYRGAV